MISTQMTIIRSVARITGLVIFVSPIPGADAPGFMLSRAPRALCDCRLYGLGRGRLASSCVMT